LLNNTFDSDCRLFRDIYFLGIVATARLRCGGIFGDYRISLHVFF